MEPGGRLPARSVGPPRPGDARTLSAAVYVQNGWTKDGRLTKKGSVAMIRKTWQNAPAAAWRGMWQLRQDALIERRWLTESGQLTQLGIAMINDGSWSNPPGTVVEQLQKLQKRAYDELVADYERRRAAHEEEARRLMPPPPARTYPASRRPTRRFRARTSVAAFGTSRSDTPGSTPPSTMMRHPTTTCAWVPPTYCGRAGMCRASVSVRVQLWRISTTRTPAAGRQLIPCLSRKKQKSAMWRCYKSSVNNTDRVGYSTFMMVAGALTGKQQKSVKAVDYVVAELVNQNRGRLERLIRKKAPAGEQKDLVLELRKVFDFVKSAFKTRIGGSSSTCPSHSQAWGLGVEDTVRAAVLAQESTYAKSLLQDQPDLFRGCKAPAVTEQVTDEETASIF